MFTEILTPPWRLTTGGMGNVYSWLNDSRYSDDGVTLKYIPFSETRNYVVKVNSSWEHYKEMYQ